MSFVAALKETQIRGMQFKFRQVRWGFVSISAVIRHDRWKKDLAIS